jgi:breast cancer 2 susceptibility protein
MQNTPRVVRSRPAFVTPFKAGMKPGELGRSLLEEKEKAKAMEVKLATPGKEVKERTQVGSHIGSHRAGKQFFDLSEWSLSSIRHIGYLIFSTAPRVERQSLLSSRLVPQEYTDADLEGKGM